MMSFHRRILIRVAKLFDLAMMIVCFAMATALVASRTPTISLARFLSMRVKVGNFALFALFLIIWHVVFAASGLYSSKRLSRLRAQVREIAKATTLGSALMFAAAIFLRIRMVTPLFALTFWAATTVTGAASRVLLRYTLGNIRRRGRNLREMVVVGTNPRAISFARKIDAKVELGYRIIGFVDGPWPGMRAFQNAGYRLVSDFEGFAHFLREQVVDEVVIALPLVSSYEEAARIASLCKEHGIIVRLLSDMFNLQKANSKAEEFAGEAFTTFYSGSQEGWEHLMKRTLDVCFSMFAMLLLFPVFLITALIVKSSSPGPALFVQERVGLNKRRFRLYKFRTMVADAPARQVEIEHLNEAHGPVFKIKNDPRITPVGRFLRKTSIDELPQLLNVLKGDMSLVGPRPLPMRDYHGFKQDWQRRRFSVRPGITCLWQIIGRTSVPFEKWMELDMEYIDQWSLGLDFKILARTIPAVIRGVGAA